MLPDLAHNPQPMPTVDYAAELEHLSAKLPDRKWRTFCRAAANAFRVQLDDIKELQDERDQMARTFAQATAVLIDYANGLKAANADLTAQNAALAANQLTPEDSATQAKVVDAAAVMVPEVNAPTT